MQWGVAIYLHQILQLTCPDTWLMTTHILHKTQDPVFLRLALLLPLHRLIPGLTADPQKVACPTDAQPGDAFLREDLPSGFFTRETP